MMKKYFALTMLTLTLAGGLLAGCGDGKDIGKEKAEELALQDAGVTKEDASRFKTTRDREDGRLVYEVEFDVQEKEYSYEISAADGEILSADMDIEENYLSSQNVQNSQNTQNTQENQGNTQTDGGQQNASVAISEEDAKKAALERVEGASESDLKMKLDFDDGQYVYEGDIRYQQKEYEFEIDANTGTFLKWSEEKY